jgi:hypothetical protein
MTESPGRFNALAGSFFGLQDDGPFDPKKTVLTKIPKNLAN